MAYASIDDYRIRYGEVSDVGMLQECLEDCSVVIEIKTAAALRESVLWLK